MEEKSGTAFPWLPRTFGGSAALALALWPGLVIATDLVSPLLEPLFGTDDLALAMSVCTFPLTFIAALAVWVRGVIRSQGEPKSFRVVGVIWGIVILPVWFAFTTMLMFPLGRISPSF